jgi:SAM-dependent methyltransferase
MYDGDIPRVYQVAADAVRATGMLDGWIIEVGCASGYYYEALRYLLRRDLHYIGIDYSPSLIAQARQVYPHVPFLIADATRLPITENGCDILFSGGVLLHVPRYDVAIRETTRAAKHWCVFHRVPVKPSAPTVFFSKRAYGVEVVELVFEEKELLGLFGSAGLTAVREFTVGSGRLEGVMDDVLTKTYVCRK